MADNNQQQPDKRWYHLENLLPATDSVDDANAANSNIATSPLFNSEYSKLPETDIDPLQDTLNEVTVFFSEQPFLGHLVLRVDNPDAAFQQSIKNILQCSLPLQPLSSSESSSAVINWVAPNEWLIMVDGASSFAIESALRQQLTNHYALVNVSGGQTLLRLSGSNAVNLLRKSGDYDFSEQGFAIGKVVTTTIGNSQALIRRVNEMTFDLVIRRSYANYIFQWLHDAGSEYEINRIAIKSAT